MGHPTFQFSWLGFSIKLSEISLRGMNSKTFFCILSAFPFYSIPVSFPTKHITRFNCKQHCTTVQLHILNNNCQCIILVDLIVNIVIFQFQSLFILLSFFIIVQRFQIIRILCVGSRQLMCL